MNAVTLHHIWTPADYHEVFERACTQRAIEAAGRPQVIELGEVIL